MLFNVLTSGRLTFTDFLTAIISSITIVFICWPVREWAKALVATKLGDPTPKYRGRLTLNPLAHLDPIGAIAMALFGIGWGKGDCYDPRYFKSYKRDTALVCLSGPLANIILGFISYILAKLSILILPINVMPYFMMIFLYIAQINVVLAAFHLIPIPPLEAGSLLPLVMSNRAYYNLMQYSRYFPYILILLMATGALNVPINFISNAVFSLFNILTFFIG